MMFNGFWDFFLPQSEFFGRSFPSWQPASLKLCGKPGRGIKMLLPGEILVGGAGKSWEVLGRAWATQGQHLPQKLPHRSQQGFQSCFSSRNIQNSSKNIQKFPSKVLGHLCSYQTVGSGVFLGWGFTWGRTRGELKKQLRAGKQLGWKITPCLAIKRRFPLQTHRTLG